jgi:hypothetical protein
MKKVYFYPFTLGQIQRGHHPGILEKRTVLACVNGSKICINFSQSWAERRNQ